MTSMEDSDHQSGTQIGSNDDLLTEILIRLPVTSILRFKSVSKHWRLLLAHKHFTRRYDINNNNNLSKSVGLFGRNIYVPFDVETRSPPPININNSLDFYFNRSHVTIEQSCNGLLLCSALHNGACEYYVFNPTTKQLAIIPSLPENTRAMALAFHQTECVHYKVVCILYSDSGRNLCQIHVYSSDTRKWKICVESFSAEISVFHHPVYWNGAIHWAPDFLASNFLYFKLDAQQLQMLPMLPEELVSGELSTMYFGESRGHLHFISNTNCEDSIMNLNVYEMLMDCSGWFVKYRVQFNELTGFPEMFDYDSGVVDVVRGNEEEEEEEEEETFLVLVTPMKLMRYNVHDKSFNPIYSQPKTNDDDFYDDDSIHDFYAQTSSCFRYIEALSCF